MDPFNDICRARVEAGWLTSTLSEICHSARIFFYGYQSPHMKKMAKTHSGKFWNATEAFTMQRYMAEFVQAITCDEGFGRKSLARMYAISDSEEDDSINSIAATCKSIVENHVALDRHVYLVINWPYMWRTLFYMYVYVRKAGLNWSDVRHLIHPVSCGGTFIPDFMRRPLTAIPRWLVWVAGREFLAWLKALRNYGLSRL